ncbi:insulin-like growth factor-binding protein complex acid labile subunit [Hydractinia symbiolongicarpus]|uniref:insulin-like growth factor-binding protein complex acid labile subunit n=1 Tax=Hydractinia symbiolongicarpus TaxID=13093 RepID=UPI00254AEA90|nr:insulin-like growth factor-binding protein complex acid labile subunit [Hydractinia symbiolongicarpus]
MKWEDKNKSGMKCAASPLCGILTLLKRFKVFSSVTAEDSYYGVRKKHAVRVFKIFRLAPSRIDCNQVMMLLFILLLLIKCGYGEKCVPVPTCNCGSDSAMSCYSRSAETLPNITNLHVESLYIGYDNVGFIPQYYFQRFSKLKILGIYGAKLVYLSRHNLSGLSRLEYLSITDSHLELIHLPAFDDLKRMRYLHLERNKLKSIPREVEPMTFKNIKVDNLFLDDNKLRNLECYTFYSLYELESLTLSNNTISIIQKNAFKRGERICNMKTLEVSCNIIEKIENGTFEGCTILETIHLNKNNISKIEGNVIAPAKSLKNIYLQNNNLRSIKPNTFNLPKVLNIRLSSNNIENVKNSLLLQNNKIKYFPHLLTFPSLSYLDLHMNRIAELPSNVFLQLPKVTYVNLSSNKIQTLSFQAFYGAELLKTLYLHDNKISEVESTVFPHLPNVTEINFGNNMIKTFANGFFQKFKNLKKLYIGHNRVLKISSEMFNGLNRLEILDDSHNQIKDINKNSFTDLKFLKHLYLSNNHINNLSADHFKYSQDLKSIKLDKNMLTQIYEERLINTLSKMSFTGLTKLKTLDLSQNKLNGLPIGFFDSAKYVTKLHLNHNQLLKTNVIVF